MSNLPTNIGKDILFYSHLGLGDNISCNGIAHYLAERYKKNIFVASKEKNYKSLSFLYKDFPNISIIPVTNDPHEEQREIIKIAEKHNLYLIRTFIRSMKDPWDVDFYNILDIDYNIKFDYCRLPSISNKKEIISKVLKKNKIKEGEDFAFVHQDKSRGFTFEYKTDLPVVFNELDLNVFEMSCILTRAAELHMMGSSLICIAELLKLPTNKQKAFFYNIRSNDGETININNKKNWKYYV